MPRMPEPPATFKDFIATYPELARAWEQAQDAARKGPLDLKTQRLVKLAIAMGAMREGAVHSAVRKARAAGASESEIAQVVALGATTLGFPATVALFSWVREVGAHPSESE